MKNLNPEPSIHEILAELQRKLNGELKQTDLAIHSLSAEARCVRMGPYAWEVKMHLEDPTSPGANKQVLIGKGENLPEDDFEFIASWVQKTGTKLNVKRPVSISVSDLS